MRKYKEAEKEAANAVRNAKRNLEKKLAKDKTKNSKPFYAYVKGRTKSKTAVGPLKDKFGNTLNSDVGMAGELKKFFASVFCRLVAGSLPKIDQMTMNSTLKESTTSTITEEKIKEKINNLRVNSAAGPDKIGRACYRISEKRWHQP
jgi:hypothetical protein